MRVHPSILAAQHMPPRLVTKRIWKERLEDIAALERYLARNGYVIRKFFLHVSKAEQKRRFLARLDVPEKNWKFQMADVDERQHWKAYMEAYEDAIRRTATPRGAVGGRARRQQVVHPAGGVERDRRRARGPRPPLPERRSVAACRAARRRGGS